MMLAMIPKRPEQQNKTKCPINLRLVKHMWLGIRLQRVGSSIFWAFALKMFQRKTQSVQARPGWPSVGCGDQVCLVGVAYSYSEEVFSHMRLGMPDHSAFL
jgi:hypothetical protein